MAPPRRYKINDEAFEQLTSTACYWLGFILADGCVQSNRNTVKVALHQKDRSHLESLQRFLETTYPIKEYGNMCELRFTSATIVKRLGSLGITPRKSCIVTAHASLRSSVDFWRGVVDGDGSLFLFTDKQKKHGKTYVYKRPGFSLVGGEALIDQFIHQFGDVNLRKVKHSKSDVYYACAKNAQARKLASVLYTGAGTYLLRKKAIADDWAIDYA